MTAAPAYQSPAPATEVPVRADGVSAPFQVPFASQRRANDRDSGIVAPEVGVSRFLESLMFAGHFDHGGLPRGSEAARTEERVEDADGRPRSRLVRQLEVFRVAPGALKRQGQAVPPEDSDREPRIAHEDEIALARAKPADAADEVLARGQIDGGPAPPINRRFTRACGARP